MTKAERLLNLVSENQALKEGDKVKILYGSNKGKTGTFVEYAPSGKFCIVSVKGKKESYHVSDIEKK